MRKRAREIAASSSSYFIALYRLLKQIQRDYEQRVKEKFIVINSLLSVGSLICCSSFHAESYRPNQTYIKI